MHWVLQENVYEEYGYESLLEILKRTGTPHSLHKVVPFVGEIIPEIQLTNPVVCFGTYSMRHAARKNGWVPGVWDLEKSSYGECIYWWGPEMLNSPDIKVFQLKDFFKVLGDNRDDAFYRPSGDNKHFSGRIKTYDEMKKLVEATMALKEDEVFYGLGPETWIVKSPVREIWAEYRCWVIDGKVITASQYKTGNRVYYTGLVDDEVIHYAQRMADLWQPARAFVLDVCKTPEGLRIVEINTMNSAGFYAANTFKLFEAIEGMNYGT